MKKIGKNTKLVNLQRTLIEQQEEKIKQLESENIELTTRLTLDENTQKDYLISLLNKIKETEETYKKATDEACEARDKYNKLSREYVSCKMEYEKKMKSLLKSFTKK